MLLVILLLILNSVLAVDYCALCKNRTHTMCQFKEGPAERCINYTKLSLSIDEKMYILDLHNDIRNHVASGQESRGAIGSQPTAADMFFLEWDDELARIAQRWADQCISTNTTFQHDKCRRTENFEVGQNIVTAITPQAQLPEVSVLILNWYKQIISVIPSDVDEFTGIWRGKQQIGQYTQLVWAKTRLVGCGATAFKEAIGNSMYNIRFVCNYGPAGNVVGQPVYQKGKPCSMCPYRVCDRVRTSLCGGVHKNVKIKKPNTMLKKYKDRATTLSNIIENEDAIINKKFLNTPEIPEQLDNDIEDLDLTNDTSLHFTYLDNTSNYSDISFQQTSKNHISWTPINDYNFTTSRSLDNETGYYTNKSTHSHISTDPPIYEDLYNITNTILSTEQSEDYKHLKFKITFAATIKLVMDSYFNESVIPEITRKSVPKDKSIIDFTKDKCERRLKLNEHITLVQDCDFDLRHSENSRSKHSSQLRSTRKILVKGNSVTLPGNRHFERATGIWHNGHCRCIQHLRSCSTTLDAIQYLILVVSFVHFVTS